MHRFLFHPKSTSLLRSLCGLALLSALSLIAQNPPRLELKDGDRVLFLGDTFFEREVDFGFLEQDLTLAASNRSVTFRNLSWAADTPLGRARASFDWNKPESEWLKQVKTEVALVKPTVAFLSYGTTAALELAATRPAEASAKTAKFIADLEQLMTAVKDVSGGPVRFVILGPPLRERSQPAEASVAPTFPEDAAVKATDAALRQIANDRQLPYVSLLEAHPVLTRLDAPPETVDGFAPNAHGHARLANQIVKMLNLDSNATAAAASDASPLLAAIRHKNELFFHRWRPANSTYLFGFRKHEQGQNAAEIPRFDPLIAQWDKHIAGLRDSQHPDPAALKAVSDQVAALQRPPPLPRNPQPVPTFEVAPELEVSLWAENPLLHKPIQMNWDPRGRLWVASSELYPMIQPGQPAYDSVVVLEDTDGDGRADRHTVFADGLVVPTGVVPDGRGGCYVAASHQLLHFADRDGDGKADARTIVLSSFGTEDTHHNLHTLRWGYDGHIYFNQSIYTHTHIETPHGVRRLNSAGIWRFNPDTFQLEIFTKGGCNPWGHHWDQYGNSFFSDGAGFKGLYHAVEGATYFTYSDMRREAESISPGNYPKFASLEIMHSPRFPADWEGTAVTCDFRAHRLVRFALNEAGSTFQTKELPDLLRSTNVTFRPIDVRTGPDGALYVADWSNPIIQHGEVDFRDPRRDKEHGRIWRIVGRANGGGSQRAPDLTQKSTRELLDLTLSPNGWEQEQSRVVLRQRGEAKVFPEIGPWLARQSVPRAKLEALWLTEAFGRNPTSLLDELVSAPDGRLRTAATRQLSR